MRDCIDSGLNWVCIALPNEVTDVQLIFYPAYLVNESLQEDDNEFR